MLLDVLISNDAVVGRNGNQIQRDLHRLFNTLQGSLKHMPEYGLPNLPTIYKTFPEGKIQFVAMVQNLIARLEPRLKNVWVEESKTHQQTTINNLIIKACVVVHELMMFQGMFYSAGHVLVKSNEVIFH